MERSLTKQVASETLLFAAHWFGTRRFHEPAPPPGTAHRSQQLPTSSTVTSRMLPPSLHNEVMSNFINKSRTMDRSGTKSISTMVRGLTTSMTARNRTDDGGMANVATVSTDPTVSNAKTGGSAGVTNVGPTGGSAADLTQSRSWNAPIREDTLVGETIPEEEEDEGQDDLKRDDSEVLPRTLGKSTKVDTEETSMERMMLAAQVSGSVAMERLLWQYRPIFTFLQTFIAVAAWAILPLFKTDPASSGNAGLESLWPGWTSFLLQRDCVDLRYQLWRWLSYQFTHASIMHILGNSVMLIIVAVPLEGFHGHIRLAILLNVGVIIGAGFDSILQNNGTLVGMSAGVYALMGMHYADVIMNWGQMQYRYGKTALLLFLILIDSLASMLNELGGASSNISHGSHFGGWVSGVLMGVLMGRNLKVHDFEHYFQAAAGACLLAIVIFMAVWLSGWPPRSIFQAEEEAWCWARQVYNATLFRSRNWECVFCSSQACVHSWSTQRYMETVAVEACNAN